MPTIKKKKIKCFNGRGGMTREFKDIMDIAMTMQIAVYMNPETPVAVTMQETARRGLKMAHNRSAWRQQLLKKYITDINGAVKANKDAIEGFFELENLRKEGRMQPLNVLARPTPY